MDSLLPESPFYVGNSAYRHTLKLASPANDAAGMSAPLKKHGCNVIEGFDLGDVYLGGADRSKVAPLEYVIATALYMAHDFPGLRSVPLPRRTAWAPSFCRGGTPPGILPGAAEGR